jgi:hypothetical protein
MLDYGRGVMTRSPYGDMLEEHQPSNPRKARDGTRILTKLSVTSRLVVAATLPTPGGSSRATHDRRS